jgi:hypothetical protein
MEKLGHIPNHLMKRIKNASLKNDQISSSYGVPERVSALEKKHKKRTPSNKAL